MLCFLGFFDIWWDIFVKTVKTLLLEIWMMGQLGKTKIVNLKLALTLIFRNLNWNLSHNFSLTRINTYNHDQSTLTQLFQLIVLFRYLNWYKYFLFENLCSSYLVKLQVIPKNVFPKYSSTLKSLYYIDGCNDCYCIKHKENKVNNKGSLERKVFILFLLSLN